MLIIGLDLAQARDYTALAVVERSQAIKDASYSVRHLERWRDVPYPEQIDRVVKLRRERLLLTAPLVVDQTGVGRAVIDAFRAAGLRPFGVSIHGGDAVSHEGRHYRVPKRDLVAVVAVLLQTRRLKIAQTLPETATLAAELSNFRMTIDPRTAHDSYSSWREADHDDLVLAVALACWWGDRSPRRPFSAALAGHKPLPDYQVR